MGVSATRLGERPESGSWHAPEEKPNRIVKTIKPASDLHIGMKQNMRTPEMKHCGVKIVRGP